MGHRQSHIRPAMERSLEDDDGLALCVRPGDLDGVLDGFRPGVKEDRFLWGWARGELGQALSQLNIDVIHNDAAVGVCESLRLLLDGAHDFGMAIPNDETSPATCKINM